METVHEEDGEHNIHNDNKNNTEDEIKRSNLTFNFDKNGKNSSNSSNKPAPLNNENSQLYEQLNLLKPLGSKNFKTTKNIFLNDGNNDLISVPTTTKTSVVLSAPIQTSSSTTLKRSHQFVTPIILPSNGNKITNKYTVHFNENVDNSSTSRDSIASNDSNDTIIEADISSLSNLDSFNSSKRNSKSDFFDQQQQQQHAMFYFNPDNLSFSLHSPANINRRNSMPTGSIIPVTKRNSLNVTDL